MSAATVSQRRLADRLGNLRLLPVRRVGGGRGNLRAGVATTPPPRSPHSRKSAPARMPTRPISALAADYPGIDIAAFASPADVNPASLTTFGVVANGVHYLGGCDTRAGPYPFCDGAARALLLVGQVAGRRVGLDAAGAVASRRDGASLVSEHVPQCSRWTGVTFENALDMATGRYRSSDDQADENAMTDEPLLRLHDACREDRHRLHALPAPRGARAALGLSHHRHLRARRRDGGFLARHARRRCRLLQRCAGRGHLHAAAAQPHHSRNAPHRRRRAPALHRLGPHADARRHRQARRLSRWRPTHGADLVAARSTRRGAAARRQRPRLARRQRRPALQ